MCKELFFMRWYWIAIGQSTSLGVKIGIVKEKMVSEHL